MLCRICDHSIQPFMTFGKMPVANGFLLPAQFEKEYHFELSPAFCSQCSTFQITEQPEADRMFHDHYAFFSRTSNAMLKHFQQYATWVKTSYLPTSNPFVVEIGSNDGIMMENFAKWNIRHLGIEPSANVAAAATEHGVNCIVNYFTKDTAKKIVAKYGHADAILAANVICHIPNLKEVAEAIAILLKPTGVFIFEEPYLGEMINKTAYDQIYDEHVYIFSAISVSNIFNIFGLELIDTLAQVTHGGSMRYVLGRKGQHTISPNGAKQMALEKQQQLDQPATYEKFKQNCEISKKTLRELLIKEKKAGRRVVGYGATSKSTTILNYADIGPDLIEFISDTTPTKINKFTPGMHIPVKHYAEFSENLPDTAVLFAWNHKDEIMAKEESFKEKKGTWIVHVPNVMELCE